MIPFGLEALGLFILLAGFVIGLGAVTVIDLHGFLGRKSLYWTEATIRTHKVTKPLIWLGTTLAIIGGGLFYWNGGWNIFSLIFILAFVCLVLNGVFLSFYVSPFLLQREKEGRSRELLPRSLQRKIVVSLIISDVLWWSNLALLVAYIFFR